MQRSAKRTVKKGQKFFPNSYEEWEAAARRRLKHGNFSYINSPAGEGMTARANNEAFYHWRLVPRVLKNVSGRDLSVRLFGSKFAAPFLLAPVGLQSRYNPQGELASARAAASYGIPFALSTAASRSIEEVASAMGDGTRWYQLYVSSDQEIMSSLLHRAKAAGYSAVVITADRGGYPQYMLEKGYEERGIANYTSDPVVQAKAKKLGKTIDEVVRSSAGGARFTWENVEFVKKESGLPVLIKGLVHPKDAELALNYGVDGIIVSNHGGRHQEGVIGTLDALPPILEVVGGKIPVLLDSGVRGGAYVVKALALGAAAVEFGHLFAYGLAVGGEAGVKEVIKNMIAEVDAAVSFCGCTSIKELDRSVIARF